MDTVQVPGFRIVVEDATHRLGRESLGKPTASYCTPTGSKTSGVIDSRFATQLPRASREVRSRWATLRKDR